MFAPRSPCTACLGTLSPAMRHRWLVYGPHIQMLDWFPLPGHLCAATRSQLRLLKDHSSQAMWVSSGALCLAPHSCSGAPVLCSRQLRGSGARVPAIGRRLGPNVLPVRPPTTIAPNRICSSRIVPAVCRGPALLSEPWQSYPNQPRPLPVSSEWLRKESSGSGWGCTFPSAVCISKEPRGASKELLSSHGPRLSESAKLLTYPAKGSLSAPQHQQSHQLQVLFLRKKSQPITTTRGATPRHSARARNFPALNSELPTAAEHRIDQYGRAVFVFLHRRRH